MGIAPDIIVTSPDAPRMLLVVEVKAAAIDEAADKQLRAYMARGNCPVGLLVTPKETRLYRHRFTGYSPDAVEAVADFTTTDLIGLEAASSTQPQLERRVQDWLEELQAKQHTLDLPAEARVPIEENLLPVLAEGRVSAAGPRWRRSCT